MLFFIKKIAVSRNFYLANSQRGRDYWDFKAQGVSLGPKNNQFDRLLVRLIKGGFLYVS